MISNYFHRLGLFGRDVWLYLITWFPMGFAYSGIFMVLFNLHLLRLGYGPEFVGVVNGVGLIALAVWIQQFLLSGGRFDRTGRHYLLDVLPYSAQRANASSESGTGRLTGGDMVPSGGPIKARYLLYSGVMSFPTFPPATASMWPTEAL